jgi:endonuclease/exonuclease/phosphatase (EEP) superfamily protein YafD
MTEPMKPKSSRLRRAIQVVSWLYLAALLLLGLLIRVAGDRWWIATLIMFGPRWIWALPMVVLIPTALLFRRRSLWVLGTAAVVVVGPIMGLCLGIGEPANPGAELRLRVLTCNTQGEQLDNDALTSLISSTQPDIVALQEWRPPRPPAVFADDQWHIVMDRDFVLGSRYPIRIIRVSFPQHAAQYRGAAVACEVQMPGRTLRFFGVHLTSPHTVFRDALHLERFGRGRVQYNSMLRGEEAQDLQQQADEFDGPVLLAGDFNLPGDSTIYRNSFGSFTDAFADAGFGFGWTYHEKWTVTRIDHILGGPGWRCSRCWIGPSVGSDHRPLLAELHWTAPAGRSNGI